MDETGIRFPEVTSKNSTEGSDTFSTFFELGKQKRKTDKGWWGFCVRKVIIGHKESIFLCFLSFFSFIAMGYVAVIYKNIADILPASSER